MMMNLINTGYTVWTANSVLWELKQIDLLPVTFDEQWP
jgi:hypothetical protein